MSFRGIELTRSPQFVMVFIWKVPVGSEVHL